ncbi:hypothetical protein KIW84_043120 [Lathyrus oleraceus]|uniref:RRM domain-containing protein n=1 Tax=Pisum sativum TaxID=3888 RepID=A0A9D4XEU8_PEA|nr:hypothetical protein KIW84_043120 [Pisum sativum]
MFFLHTNFSSSLFVSDTFNFLTSLIISVEWMDFIFFRSRSRSPERGANPTNPGNTLYVTGLSSRVTERDLEEHFSKEGKVASCFLVVEPRTRISRGFAFVTMDSHEDAERCIKYLNQSVLEGRYVTVERTILHQLCWQQSEMIG